MQDQDSSAQHQGPDQLTTDGERSGFSRRDFIRTAAAGGAALSLPGVLAKAADAAPVAIDSGAVRKGGTLRVAVAGGGASETLNPNQVLAEIDTARSRAMFEGLVDFDPNGKVVNVLAQELSTNANASVWKIRVRDGVVFHNGKTFDADDVVRCFRYILDPKNKTQGAGTLTGLRPVNIRKLDRTTVQFRLDRPNAFLADILGDLRIRIFYGTTFSHPIGTGPFMFKSWKRGERSLFVRNPRYWRNGLPYLDGLEYISISDPGARLNAVIAGQVHAMSQLDPKLLAQVMTNSKLKLLQKPSGNYTAIYVQTDVAPFTDNRVRQALRYMTDRPQIVANALLGRGRIGNDLPCWFDADYAREIAQRPHDPERAAALLKAAGQEGLKLELQTSDVAPAMLESSTLFAQQAKQAGVSVSLRQWPTDQYYSSGYDHFPFAMTNWGGRPLPSQINLAYLTTSVYNETHFKKPKLDALVRQAFATPNKAKRHKLMVDAQRILFDEGGTIIWGFLSSLNVSSTKVNGITPSVIRDLGNYDLSRAWIAA
jgi:peptide/nickel transport system substrate-binding protein